MKKLFIIALLGFMISQSGQAQEIGVRVGDIQGNYIAADIVFGGQDRNSRYHIDISFGKKIGIESLWDFLYGPLAGEAFYYYAGVGLSMLIGKEDDLDDPFSGGPSGEIGLEYRFHSIPIAIGADWRPVYLFNSDDNKFQTSNFGLNIRFVF